MGKELAENALERWQLAQQTASMSSDLPVTRADVWALVAAVHQLEISVLLAIEEGR